jgi:GNAT superfamily N-acetyltransferase
VKTQVEFCPDFSPTVAQWAQLKAAVDTGHVHRPFYMSMNGLLSARSVKLAALVFASEILAFLFYADRAWCYRDNRYTGRSLGLITTVEAHQGSGFAKRLVYEIAEFALEKDIDFLYLQGIPNFYSKFGFHGFAPKRKFVFDPSVFKYKNCKVFLLSTLYHDRVKQVYKDYSRSIGSYIERSEEEWRDLFYCLSSTFLFYQPRVITLADGRFIGYFCISPTDPTQVREFAFIPSEENAFYACSAVANFVRERGASRLEIFSPANGSIYSLCFNKIDSDFICYFRSSSSNMIKWLSGPKSPKPFEDTFIFQGDNL